MPFILYYLRYSFSFAFSISLFLNSRSLCFRFFCLYLAEFQLVCLYVSMLLFTIKIYLRAYRAKKDAQDESKICTLLVLQCTKIENHFKNGLRATNTETSSKHIAGFFYFYSRCSPFHFYYTRSFELFIIRTNIHCINKLLKLSSS